LLCLDDVQSSNSGIYEEFIRSMEIKRDLD